MKIAEITFDDAICFHGHACPGLAFGFRVAQAALIELGNRPVDEEIIAIVENLSCAVDAIQVVSGCTLGKGNLFINDYGKQVYTFLKRPSGEGVRIAVTWKAPPETAEAVQLWERYSKGDTSKEVLDYIKTSKLDKMKEILDADSKDLFEINHVTMPLPQKAQVFESLRCSKCGEKVMAPKARVEGESVLCEPCAEKNVMSS